MTTKKHTILFLVGGDSPERDVSIESGKSMYEALKKKGYKVIVADPGRPEIPPTEDPAKMFEASQITAEPPIIGENIFASRAAFLEYLCGFEKLQFDVVFNALHGGVGEDGTLQACLDFLGISYTGSGALACALAMNKSLSKHLVSSRGVPLAEGFVIKEDELEMADIEQRIQDEVGFPVVIKPNQQGSSVGVSIVDEPGGLHEAFSKAAPLDRAFLVERYIEGTEVTASILGNEALPLLEIRTKEGFYDYRNKYTPGANEYLVPAPIDAKTTEAIQTSALRAYHALGCRAYARVDFRLAKDCRHYFLEINTLPGMTASSLVPKAAKAAGIDFSELVERILHLSLETR
ncbi:MAG: D-alanine--D-alanine ligase [Candidatus Latescibacteria bacterium]|nr:D-alanine--D-alanine ligase [Candidatus Latescibacterota bacterium]NIM22567.1 D-alanine--D-alanine ligase [Candidatus Latescibacterota bacterium]NIM64856.1 D-alanine--D-alanine ligase [Candidatus Latescibacterota bacterium]NIO01371.1 D-alanine--D-alanine ligase [Candidatus Latescibacterota bacterium]NIO27881.1 D-alanine--D-alanine ligase [Candidatus Latescibacterota bacterium]